MVLYTYFFALQSDKRAPLGKLDRTITTEVRRACTWLFTPIARLITNDGKLHRMWQVLVQGDSLFPILVILTDQQIITGLAIITVGYAKTGTMTEYHFAIVSNLATLTVVVHDSVANVLRHRTTHHGVNMQAYKAIAVICFMMMALVAQIPSGHRYWLVSYGLPVQCIWNSINGNIRSNTPQSAVMGTSLFLYTWAIIVTVDDYFPKLSSWAFDNAFVRAANIYFLKAILLPRTAYFASARKRALAKTELATILWSIFEWSCFLMAAVIFTLCEVLNSEVLDLQRIWLLLITSIQTIFVLRDYAGRNGRVGNEDGWGFGQAVPIFLLLIPLSTILEAIYGTPVEVEEMA